MAKVTQKSSLAAKLGSRVTAAVATHKDDETVIKGGGNLPEGIEGGIAQVVECKFDTHKDGDHKGEIYFYMGAVVVEPKYIGHRKIEGQRTSVTEPVYDTPDRTRKTVEDHIAHIMNEMRKAGADTASMDPSDEGALESLAASIKEAGPFITFRTWKGKKATTGPYANKEPMVQEQWQGLAEYDGEAAAEAAAEDAVQDRTPAPPRGTTAKAPTAAKPAAKAPAASTEADPVALGTAADGGDTDAAKALEAIGDGLGVSSGDYGTWAEVAEAVLAAQGGGGTELPDDAAAAAASGDESFDGSDAAKEATWFFRKPRARKYTEGEVTAVFPGQKTCNFKDLATGEITQKVAWDALKATDPNAG